MAVFAPSLSSVLSLKPSSSLRCGLISADCHRHHRGSSLGTAAAAVRSSSRGVSGTTPRVGRVVTASTRVSDFTGLKKNQEQNKMSGVTEGLAKRVRDPQLAADEAKSHVAKTRNYVSAQMSKPGVKSLAIAVAIPLLLGSVNALFNSPFSQWFADLKKPWWEPPGPIFGGAWSVLYPLMGLSSWLVWAEGGFHQQTRPLTLYVAQLFLNLLWPMLFFGWKKLGLALVNIIILDGVLAATINAFQPVNHVAANLLKPYLAWLLFATALNFNLWLTNRGTAAQPAQ